MTTGRGEESGQTITLRHFALAKPGAVLSGELRPCLRELVGDQFEADGMHVEVAEESDRIARVQVTRAGEWAGTTDELRANMEVVVEPYTLACAAEARVPLHVVWDSFQYRDAHGHGVVGGWITIQASISARRRALSTFAADAAVIARHAELADAMRRCRDALGLLPVDGRAAMSLSFLAIEGLVDHQTSGRVREVDWRTSAPAFGSTEELILQLFHSTQVGRHTRPGRTRWLTDHGLPPLNPGECCNRAADLVIGYKDRI